MKQLLQNLRNGETYIADVPVPQPQPGTVLVRTAVSLVSAGTERMVVEFAEKSLVGKARSRPDLVRQVLDKARREGVLTTVEAAFGRLDQPMPLGYSSAGRIVALGEGVSDLQTGQRVACAGGGYAVHAEYNLVPKNLVTPLPDNVDDEAAAFTTLGAIALHGFRLASPQLGERVAVIGLGLLGLLAVGIVQAAGCSAFGIDINPNRVALARSVGCEAVLRDGAEEVARSFSRGLGMDAVLICADTPSNDPVELAGEIARDRAKVVAIGAVGLELPRKIYYSKELAFINSRSYGPGRYDPGYEEKGQDYPVGYVRWTEGRNFEAFVDLLAAGKVDLDPLVSHRFPIAKAPAAYELITGKRQTPFLGVLLTYPQDDGSAEESGAEPVAIPQPERIAFRRSTGELRPARVGVLGAGNFANAVLLPALKSVPGVDLVGITSAAGMHAHHAAKKFGFEFAAPSVEDIIANERINTVFVLTRHHLHAPQVLASLSAGKNVFCEKPLALNNDELSAIEALLNQRATSGDTVAPLLMVGFNRRFAPLARKMVDFLAGRSEPISVHYRINAGYIPLDHWVHDPLQGGGRIIGEGCHFVDFLTYLVGKPPLAVSAVGLPDSGRYQEDNVNLTFEFDDGSIGIVTYLANGDKAFSKERVEVFAGGRVAVLDDFRSIELVVDGRRKVVRSRLRQDKGHRQELITFTQAIAHGDGPPIPYEQIFGVMRATFAAVEALRQGKRMSIPSIAGIQPE